LTVADESRLEPAVVSALFREHSQELHRFLMGVLRDWQLAHDVLQATFAKAVEVGHTSAAETRKAWLFRVAYHEAMAVRRRQGVDGKALRQIAWTQDAGIAGDEAAAPAIRAETVDRVREAIAELPAVQQQVLRMRIYEEKTFAVIAQELQIPLGTALARMRTAMEKLRKKLQ
jgi:RNA polymerase sigma-70 factor (ECF subfamily)